MLEKAPDAQVSATANDDTGVTPAPSQESASAVTAGVAKIQGITRSWNKSRYIFFWACMMLIAICVSLDYQTVNAYQPYALSEFKSHSLLSAVSTLQIILLVSFQFNLYKFVMAGRSPLYTNNTFGLDLHHRSPSCPK